MTNHWAAAFQVFKVSTQFLHRSSNADLAAVIQDLRRRHIALAMEAEILVATTRCGNGIPGYTTTAVIKKAAERVAAQGGEIAYVGFDEPTTGGHFARRACQYTTEEFVYNIAPSVKALKAVFPAVRFGDIEPVTDQTSGRLSEILKFAALFKAKTGKPLTFLQADLIWQNNWRPQLTVWKSRLHAAGLSYGVVIDGDPGDHSDLAWTGHAVQRFHELVADPTISPDAFIIPAARVGGSRRGGPGHHGESQQRSELLRGRRLVDQLYRAPARLLLARLRGRAPSRGDRSRPGRTAGRADGGAGPGVCRSVTSCRSRPCCSAL